MNRIIKRMAIPVGAAIVLGSSGFAFMASNAVDHTYAGDGSNLISGYNVTDVHYDVYKGQVADVHFRLDQVADAGNVSAVVWNADKSDSAIYDTCAQATNTGIWTCNNNASASMSVKDARYLEVIAAQ